MNVYKIIFGIVLNVISVSVFSNTYYLSEAEGLDEKIELLDETNHEIVIGHHVQLTNSLYVPSNIRLVFIGDGKISILNSGRIELYGSIEAGLHQIFELNSGSMIGHVKTGTASPEWFGLYPNDTVCESDSGDIIQTMMNVFSNVKLNGTYSVNLDGKAGALALNQRLQSLSGGTLVLCDGVQLIYAPSGVEVSDLDISDIKLVNHSASVTTVAITERGPVELGGINDSRISNVRIENFSYGVNVGERNLVNGNRIRIHNIPSQSPASNVKTYGIHTRARSIVSENIIENLSGGVFAGSFSTISNNTILNAWGENGIYAPGGKELIILGNTINRSFADGIALNSSADSIISDNNIISPGNAGIRLQNSRDTIVKGNRVDISQCGSHFVRQGVNSSVAEITKNIAIENNLFKGRSSQDNLSCIWGAQSLPGTPIYFEDGLHQAIRIENNQVSQVNLSNLLFQGLIVNAKNADLINNRFNDSENIGLYGKYFDVAYQFGNHVLDSNGMLGTKNVRQGNVAVAFGSGGSVFSSHYDGVIKRIEKLGEIGRYKLTFSHSLHTPVMTYSTSHHVNSPDKILVIGSNWPQSAKFLQQSEMIIELRNSNGQAYWPHYSAQVYLHIN